VELIFFTSSTLHATWQVDGTEIENCVLVRIDVYLPALLVNTDDAANDHIADVWPVVASHGPHANYSVDVVHYPSH